jgi:hypothetical protein
MTVKRPVTDKENSGTVVRTTPTDVIVYRYTRFKLFHAIALGLNAMILPSR